MKQHAFEFDSSVAVEGFRQSQTANEHSFSQEQRDAWLKQFLAHARKVFGLPAQPKSVICGFAHYIRAHAMCKPGCRLLWGKLTITHVADH